MLMLAARLCCFDSAYVLVQQAALVLPFAHVILPRSLEVQAHWRTPPRTGVPRLYTAYLEGQGFHGRGGGSVVQPCPAVKAAAVRHLGRSVLVVVVVVVVMVVAAVTVTIALERAKASTRCHPHSSFSRF
jgi:hypothetical protein